MFSRKFILKLLMFFTVAVLLSGCELGDLVVESTPVDRPTPTMVCPTKTPEGDESGVGEADTDTASVGDASQGISDEDEKGEGTLTPAERDELLDNVNLGPGGPGGTPEPGEGPPPDSESGMEGDPASSPTPDPCK